MTLATNGRRSILHFKIQFNTDIVATDFEEQLQHSLGKNATDALKFRLWLYKGKRREQGMEKAYSINQNTLYNIPFVKSKTNKIKEAALGGANKKRKKVNY